MSMTLAELEKRLATYGGELGGPGQSRHQIPGAKVPGTYKNPDGSDTGVPIEGGVQGPPRWVIETPHGDVTVEPQPDGTYLPISQPNPTAPQRGAVGGPPATVPGRKGTVWLDPSDNTWKVIQGTEPLPAAPTNVGGEFWRWNEETGEMEMVGASPSSLADRQVAAAEKVATAQRNLEASRRQDLQMQMNAIKMAQDAGEIDAKRAAELRDYLFKTGVEYPEKLRQQEDVLRGNAITAGTQAGAAAVSDVTAMLPYRYSPGFGERRDAALAGAARGEYRPQPIARGYVGPDLAATRQQAEGQYRNQYLQQFGFDPQNVASQVGYRAPGAVAGPSAAAVGGGTAAAPLSGAGGGDDEEYLKQLAAQLAQQ